MDKEVVKPANCVLAIAIPTTELEFRSALNRPVPGDFASRNPAWAKYRHDIVEPFLEAESSYRACGVQVITNTNFSKFGDAIRSHAQVVTLFAHWIGDAVEFADGPRKSEEIVELIDVEREGVLDLCVCHPERLVRSVKQHSRLTTVRYSLCEAKVDLWFGFYRVLYATLLQYDIDFATAIERTVGTFRTALKSRRNL